MTPLYQKESLIYDLLKWLKLSIEMTEPL